MNNKFNLAKWLTTNIIVFTILLFLSIAFPIESCKYEPNPLVSKEGDATNTNTSTSAIEQDEAELKQLALTSNSKGNGEPDYEPEKVEKAELEPGNNNFSTFSSRQLSLPKPQQETESSPLSDEPNSVSIRGTEQGDNNSERRLSNKLEKDSTNEPEKGESGGQDSIGQEIKNKPKEEKGKEKVINLQPEGPNKLEERQPITVEEGKGKDNQEPKDPGTNQQVKGQNKSEQAQSVTVERGKRKEKEGYKKEKEEKKNEETKDQEINLQELGQAQSITVEEEGKGKDKENFDNSNPSVRNESSSTQLLLAKEAYEAWKAGVIADPGLAVNNLRKAAREGYEEAQILLDNLLVEINAINKTREKNNTDLEGGTNKSQEELSITKEKIEEINTKADKLSGKILSPILNFFNITTTAVGSVSIYKDEAVSTLTTTALVCLALLSLVSLLIRIFTSYIPKVKIWFRYRKMDEDSKKLILKDFGKEVGTSVFDFLVEFFRFVSQGLLLFAGSDLMGESNLPTILVAIGAFFSFIALTIAITPVIYTGISNGYNGIRKAWSFLKRNLLEEKID